MDQMMGGKGTDDKQQTAPCVPKSKHLPQHHPDLFWSDNAKSSPAENNPESEICPHTMENHPAACLWSNASGSFLFFIWVELFSIWLNWFVFLVEFLFDWMQQKQNSVNPATSSSSTNNQWRTFLQQNKIWEDFQWDQSHFQTKSEKHHRMETASDVFTTFDHRLDCRAS